MTADKHEYHGTCARAVGEALLFLDNVLTRDLTFTEKESPRDLVSAADIAVHNLICRKLQPSGIPILSEEHAASRAAIPAAQGLRWVLDPVDGTTNFAARIPLFGVSLGLMEGLTFCAGAFGMPATRELFYTVNADASYLNDARLRPERRTLATSLVGACFSSRGRNSQECRDREFRVFGMANDRSRGCVRLGSAGVTICYTAAGKLGAAYAVHSWIWDVAAALAIAQAAGCRVLVAADDGQPSVSCIVGRGEVVEELKGLLQDVLGFTTWTESEA